MHNTARRNGLSLAILAIFAVLMTILAMPDAYAARKHKNKTGRHPANAQPQSAQAAAPTPAEPLISDTIAIDRVEGSTLFFRAPQGQSTPKPLTLDLSDIRPLGTLRPATPGGQAYLLIRARPCRSCTMEPAIFALRPDGGKLHKFVEPGRILDNKSRALVMESRAFYGRCLFNRKHDVYVVFQKEKVDRRSSLQSSVVIAESITEALTNGKPHDTLHEMLLERNLPRLNDTLKLVKAKSCREIDGRYRVMATRPLDIWLRRQKMMEEADDDSAPRENQTDRDFAPPKAQPAES